MNLFQGHYSMETHFPAGDLKRINIMPFGSYKTSINLWEHVNEENIYIGYINVYDSHEHTRIMT